MVPTLKYNKDFRLTPYGYKGKTEDPSKDRNFLTKKSIIIDIQYVNKLLIRKNLAKIRKNLAPLWLVRLSIQYLTYFIHAGYLANHSNLCYLWVTPNK
jgi:hypothetical protein